MLDSILNSRSHTDDRVAVIDQGESYSFDRIHLAARTLAQRLNRIRFTPGDRIAALLPNSMHAVVACQAAATTGHGYLPLNTGLKQAELSHLFQKCNVRVVICRAAIRNQVPAGVEIVAVDEVLAGPSADAPRLNEESASLAADRPFVCLSTSGSTGEPRLVERTAAAVFANVERVARGLEVTREDRFLSVVPFWHANGYSNCLLLPLTRGASMVTMGRFLPRQMLDLILQSKPTVVIGSPFIFHALARVLQPGCDFDHVRCWISSGASLPAALDEKLRKLKIPVRQLYGSSETGTISISSGTKHHEGSVGKPLTGVELRIVDSENQELPQGQSGEVQVASTSLFSGYVGAPPGVSHLTEDGFYCMSDRGVLDGEGRLTLTGRTDAMINVSGVKVDPMEIQQVLVSMPGIKQALVFGIRDVNGMDMIKSLVVVDGDISTENILDYCRKQLAEYKLPRTIEFVGTIPQDLMGKSARSLLEN